MVWIGARQSLPPVALNWLRDKSHKNRGILLLVPYYFGEDGNPVGDSFPGYPPTRVRTYIFLEYSRFLLTSIGR
jgi:hypothetical protein